MFPASFRFYFSAEADLWVQAKSVYSTEKTFAVVISLNLSRSRFSVAMLVSAMFQDGNERTIIYMP